MRAVWRSASTDAALLPSENQDGILVFLMLPRVIAARDIREDVAPISTFRSAQPME